jgi:hypothetical protein
MGADAELEIIIRLLSDTKGADAVQEALNKTKGATGDVSKATENLGQKNEEGAKHAEKFELSHRAVHQILHLIAQESGPAAGAALSSLAAAGTGSILILIMAARELLELLKQNSEAAKKLAETIASGVDTADFIKGLEEMRGAMLNAADEANSFEEALRKIESAQESLSQKAETAIGLIRQELAADLAVAAAKKQAMIEEIKAKEALGQITKTAAQAALADLESKSEKEANERKQKARQDELAELKNAQTTNREQFPDAKAEAEKSDRQRQQAEENAARRKFIVDQAKEALDESKEGSVSAQLKKKQAALDEIPLLSQHDYLFGQGDDANNLKIQIESLTALKKQAEAQVKQFGSVDSEHHYEEATKDAQRKAADAEERARKLDEENKALAKKISDLEAAHTISTAEENTTAQFHDQAREQQSIQTRATDDRSTVAKDISSAHRDIEEIQRTATRAQTSGATPQDIAQARAAVADLAKVMGELPKLVADLQKLGAPTADLQRQINDLRAASNRSGY